MNLESYQNFLIPIAVIAFFSYRFYKFNQVKKNISNYVNNGAVIVDVRSKNEFQLASNPNSLNIPLDELNSKTKELTNQKMIIVCCASGTRSAMAMGILKKNGIKNVINAGPWTNTLVK